MKALLNKIAQSTLAAPAAAFALAATVNAQVTSVSAPQGYFNDIGEAINSVLTFVFVIAVLLVFLYIVWGGITWITSGGDKGKTEEARNKITAAVVGLIILLASFAILQLVIRFFTGGDINDALNRVA